MFRPLWVSHSLSSASAGSTAPVEGRTTAWAAFPSSHNDLYGSPPSSPHLRDAQREQLVHNVSLLSSRVMQLTHKAQTQGLSLEERVSLEGQLASLESYIACINPAHRPPSPASSDDVDDNIRHEQHTGREVVPHPGVMLKAHKKRAKRTFNRACVHCGTQFTSQWRKGPAGASTLCNACGIRYARRLKKDAKAQAEAAKCTASGLKQEEARRSSVYALLN